MAFFHELMRIHLGRRHDPEARRQTGGALEHLAGRTVMSDVGHARTDEDFVDLVTADFGQRLDIVRVIRACQQRLRDFIEIDLDDFGVFRVSIGFEQLRVLQPGFHRPDSTLQGAPVLVAVGYHPLEQGDVRIQVFDDRLPVEAYGAAVG